MTVLARKGTGMRGVFVPAEHFVSTGLPTPHKKELDYVTRRFNESSARLKRPLGWTYGGTALYAISRCKCSQFPFTQ
jgi:hypothetical protein